MTRETRRILALALPVLQLFRKAWWRLARPKTFGVRAVVFDEAGRLVLVRHGYEKGLYLPGGGMKGGEAPDAAIRRELAEEIGAAALADLRLFATYSSNREGKRDTIRLFIARGACLETCFDPEITEVVRCDPDAPPADLSPATRRRLAEVMNRTAPSPTW